MAIIDGPVQENSYDCGIYTTTAAEYVILHVINGNQLGSLSIPTVSSLDCIKKRSFLAYVIVNGVSTPKDILLSLMANNLCSNIGTKTKNRVPFLKKQGV